MQRRDFIKTAGVLALSAVAANAAQTGAKNAPKTEKIGGLNLTTEWDKTFPKSDKVNHRKVAFKNRYGITLAADLYEPKSAKSGAKLAAIAISGPFGAVKEQSSGLYAQTLAERGFATLAFDPSFTGESGGEPRNVASPDINTEDFSAAVDFLSLLPEVDSEKIGALGVCGFGGLVLNAAAMDTRIKAVASSVMYDMSRAMGHGVGDGRDRYTKADRAVVLKYLNAKRLEEARAGHPIPGGHDIAVVNGVASAGDRILPETLPENPHPILKEFFDYYRVPRGFHPRSVNSTSAWNSTMPLSFMNMKQLSYIDEISPRPILIVTGEVAHSRYFAEGAYERAAQPKELVIVKGANHVDLYDTDKIPFDKFEKFFKSNLK